MLSQSNTKPTLNNPSHFVGYDHTNAMDADIPLLSDTDLFLLFTVPMKYEDRRVMHGVDDFSEGETSHVNAAIQGVDYLSTRTGKEILKIACTDSQLKPFTATFFHFNQYLTGQLRPGTRVILSGKPKPFRNAWTLSQPKILDTGDMGKITPVYRKDGRVTSQKIMQRIREGMTAEWLKKMLAAMPPEHARVLSGMELPDLRTALRDVHWPRDLEAAADGMQALRVTEMVLSIQRMRMGAEAPEPPGAQAFLNDAQAMELTDALPFTLTPSQAAAWAEIRLQLRSPAAARVLVLGGVGSGKSAIAYLSAMAHALYGMNGKKVAYIVAPTSILADQLFAGVSRVATALGISVYRGHGRQMKGICACIEEDVHKRGAIVVGTHGLIGKNADWRHVGLLVLDEEHRFGSEIKDIPESVNRIWMSATPIPATLANIRFGGMKILRLRNTHNQRDVTCMALTKKATSTALERVAQQLGSGSRVLLVYGTISKEDDAAIPEAFYQQLDRFGNDSVVCVEKNDIAAAHKPHLRFYDAADAIRDAAEKAERRAGGPSRFYRLNLQFSSEALVNQIDRGGDLLSWPVLLYDLQNPDRLFQVERHHFFNGGMESYRGTKALLTMCRAGVLPALPFYRESALRAGKTMEDALPMWESMFPGKVAALHGRMNDTEKRTVLDRFRSGDCPVLVATSIVEVGVDIEGVDVIIVANADRLGVSSLVQLRGRVGRHGKPGFCFFIGQDNEESMARLQRIAGETDDEQLAIMDFWERGFGDAQNGIQSGNHARLFRLPRDARLFAKVARLVEQAD